MKKIIYISLLLNFLFLTSHAQTDSLPANTNEALTKENFASKTTLNNKTSIYKINSAVDIPIVVTGTAWSLFAFTKIYNKAPSSIEKILSLKKEDINVFDRWAVYPYSEWMDKVNYYPFYVAIPLPLIFFITDKEMRSDYLKLTFLYWEAMSITGLFGTGATYTVNRYRPCL